MNKLYISIIFLFIISILLINCGEKEKASITIYQDSEFKGEKATIDKEIADLNKVKMGADGNFNDQISSIKIKKGTWKFFEHNGFNKDEKWKDGKEWELAPGEYNDLKSKGIDNDSISSFKCIKDCE